MSALRAPTVTQGPTFRDDVEALRNKYPEIDSVITELAEALTVSWHVPHRPIPNQSNPHVYGVALDYPPHGSSGIGVLLVTYHATPEAMNKMSEPLRRYTLLTLSDRQAPAAD